MAHHHHIPRIYTPYAIDAHTPIPLDIKQAHHICHVLRKKAGDSIKIFNETAGEWQGHLEILKKKEWSVRPITCLRTATRDPKLGLICAPIKHDRMSFMMEKATEVGVTDIVFLKSDHTPISMPSLKKYDEILILATQQCERLVKPILHEPVSLHALIEGNHPSFFQTHWSFYVARERFEYCTDTHSQRHPPCLIIGPEGGWSEAEQQLFDNTASFHSLTLSPHILRSETAAIVGLSRLSEFGYKG